METDWAAIKRSLAIGTLVRCSVMSHEPFGVFVSIEGVPFPGLIQITDFKDSGRMMAREYPAIDTILSAIVLGYQDRNQQIWVGVKPSQLRGATAHHSQPQQGSPV